MQHRMVSIPLSPGSLREANPAQLSKEDEAATGSEENEVRREDQDKINK
jgi:hypothetical protein